MAGGFSGYQDFGQHTSIEDIKRFKNIFIFPGSVLRQWRQPSKRNHLKSIPR